MRKSSMTARIAGRSRSPSRTSRSISSKLQRPNALTSPSTARGAQARGTRASKQK